MKWVDFLDKYIIQYDSYYMIHITDIQNFTFFSKLICANYYNLPISDWLDLSHLRYTVESRFCICFKQFFIWNQFLQKRENEAQFSKNDEKAFGK